MKTRGICGGVVGAGEGIKQWLRNLSRVVAAGNESTVEGKERLVDGCSDT